jgi:hypothetical protein
MKTYKDIDEFIMEVFPQEDQMIKERKPSDEQRDIEKANVEFEQKLAEIIEGKKEEQKETP